MNGNDDNAKICQKQTEETYENADTQRWDRSSSKH